MNRLSASPIRPSWSTSKPTLKVVASSGSKSGLPLVSTRLKAPVAPTNCSELDEFAATVWFRVGPRKVVPTEARMPMLGSACQRMANLGSTLEPVAPP